MGKKRAIKTENIRIRDVSVGTFFRFSLKKIILDLSISVLLFVWFMTSVPLAKDILMKEILQVRIFDIVGNILLYAALFYPLCCYLILLISKKERK
jgi:hypothetical protein